MKILIVGDSFAADWSVKYNDYHGWPNLLAQKFEVTNLAKAGVGQYKIYKQLQNIDIKNFDIVISSYTSPYRVHTQQHPVHYNDPLHNTCDLLANDIEYFAQNDKNNESLKTARNYFKYHFDFEYYDTIYAILVEKCNELIGNTKHIQVSNLKYVTEAWKDITEKHQGLINHLSEEGNKIVFKKLVNMI
jgi:hypothetical protein|tara:strand:+ start:436 stop:1002 length:567 start_codon:yes stop_codon:yes gene_type:complete